MLVEFWQVVPPNGAKKYIPFIMVAVLWHSYEQSGGTSAVYHQQYHQPFKTDTFCQESLILKCCLFCTRKSDMCTDWKGVGSSL